MKKIQIYDLKAFLMENAGKDSFRFHKVAIFEGEDGVLVAEAESVYLIENIVTDTIRIPCNAPPSPGKCWIDAKYTADIVIKDLLESAPTEEMTMTEFFSKRTYGIRCQNNWSKMLKGLREVGFDISEYL